jgi:hypothetical protein
MNIRPTAIELLSFTATYHNGFVKVRWTTGAEIDTWGFHVLRSVDDNRANAVQLNDSLLRAQGQNTSVTSYIWTDFDIEEGVQYTYWLQEVELDGTTNEYGPAITRHLSTQDTKRVYLPLIVR